MERLSDRDLLSLLSVVRDNPDDPRYNEVWNEVEQRGLVL